MATVTLRNTKGSALTFTEMDDNFSNLNTDKLEDITSESIGNLSDVDTTGVANNSILKYNSTSGNWEIGLDTDTGIVYTDLSVGAEGTPSGDGSLAYNNTTGEFTYTPPTASGLGALEDITGESIGDLSDVTFASLASGDVLSYNGANWENTPGAAAGATQLNELSDVDASLAPSDGQILVYNTTNGYFQAETKSFATGSELENVVEDTTPQLGGDLDGQGNTVSDVQLEDYKETVYSLGSTDSPSIDASNGNVQTVTITSGLDIPDISNFDTGATVTLIVSGDGSATDGTTGSICKFANSGDTTHCYRLCVRSYYAFRSI